MKKIGICNIADLEDGVVPKKWGSELIIHNGEDYCGKVLKFNAGAEFSMHFHMKKSETWFVAKGEFLLKWIDPEDASEHQKVLRYCDVIEIPQGQPHQLSTFSGGDIFEVSTPHFDEDSYRIKKGDSQK